MAADMTLDDASCPIIDSPRQVGSQWRLIALHNLQDGGKRFNKLERSTGVSLRMLSRVFDGLQEHSFVNRRMEEDAPMTTYYSLTDKGVSLCSVFDEVRGWAIERLDAEREKSAEGGMVQSTA